MRGEGGEPLGGFFDLLEGLVGDRLGGFLQRGDAAFGLGCGVLRRDGLGDAGCGEFGVLPCAGDVVVDRLRAVGELVEGPAERAGGALERGDFCGEGVDVLLD